MKYYFAKFIKFFFISAKKNCQISKNSKVGSANNLLNVSLGKYSYIGSYCTVVDVEIGNFCSIADNCVIGGAQHPIEWGSTSPVFHSGRNILKKNISKHHFETTKKTHIGNDVWIGNNVLIKSGVTIGNGAVIGMGSVVTKSVGDYEIWAGNPARIIRKRFNDEIINDMNKSQWWYKDDDTLMIIGKNINNVNEFVSVLNGMRD